MAPARPPSTCVQLLGRLSQPTDNDAWRQFLLQYKPALDAWAARCGLQPHDADEVTAQVLMALVRALPQLRLDPSRSFRGYLHRMIRNAAASHWRGRATRPDAVGVGGSGGATLLAEVPDWGPMADEVGDRLHADLHRLERVFAAVRRRVTPAGWEAYHQTAVAGLPAAEVAERLSMSVAAVYMAKSRIGRMVRDEVGRAGGDP